MNLELTSSARLISQQTPGIGLSSLLRGWQPRQALPCPDFSHEFRGSNSGLPVFTASTLVTEPSPRLCIYSVKNFSAEVLTSLGSHLRVGILSKLLFSSLSEREKPHRVRVIGLDNGRLMLSWATGGRVGGAQVQLCRRWGKGVTPSCFLPILLPPAVSQGGGDRLLQTQPRAVRGLSKRLTSSPPSSPPPTATVASGWWFTKLSGQAL